MSDESEMERAVGQVVEHTKNDEHYALLALALGYNELAKLARTLGEKVYFRLLRDRVSDALVAAGGNGGESPFAHEDGVIQIKVDGDRMPWVKLYARDVELMRAYVAEHDKTVAEAGENIV